MPSLDVIKAADTSVFTEDMLTPKKEAAYPKKIMIICLVVVPILIGSACVGVGLIPAVFALLNTGGVVLLSLGGVSVTLAIASGALKISQKISQQGKEKLYANKVDYFKPTDRETKAKKAAEKRIPNFVKKYPNSPGIALPPHQIASARKKLQYIKDLIFVRINMQVRLETALGKRDDKIEGEIINQIAELDLKSEAEHPIPADEILDFLRVAAAPVQRYYLATNDPLYSQDIKPNMTINMQTSQRIAEACIKRFPHIINYTDKQSRILLQRCVQTKEIGLIPVLINNHQSLLVCGLDGHCALDRVYQEQDEIYRKAMLDMIVNGSNSGKDCFAYILEQTQSETPERSENGLARLAELFKINKSGKRLREFSEELLANLPKRHLKEIAGVYCSLLDNPDNKQRFHLFFKSLVEKIVDLQTNSGDKAIDNHVLFMRSILETLIAKKVSILQRTIDCALVHEVTLKIIQSYPLSIDRSPPVVIAESLTVVGSPAAPVVPSSFPSPAPSSIPFSPVSPLPSSIPSSPFAYSPSSPLTPSTPFGQAPPPSSQPALTRLPV